MSRIRGSIGIALGAAVLMGVSACGGGSGGDASSSDAAKTAHQAAAKPTPKPKPTPKGKPMLLDSITPQDGAKVGVAMPISVVFSKPVKQSARADIEKHLKLTSSTPVTGAWHWFGNRRVDFRPKEYWKPGTKVKLDAALFNVGDGEGRYGRHSYKHAFTIGDDVRTSVNVPNHTAQVKKDGKVVRTMPVDAGSPSNPSWNGTMAVMDKQRDLRMTSCSVGLSCKKGSPNYYDDHFPWDIHLTQSGTYMHYSKADPSPGHANGSHGCVHMSLADAKWYYNLTKQGDPVTITGSSRAKAPADNGYASFNLPWSQWLAESGTGAQQIGA